MSQTTPDVQIENSADLFWSETNQALLRRSIEQLDAGRGVRHELIETEDNA